MYLVNSVGDSQQDYNGGKSSGLDDLQIFGAMVPPTAILLNIAFPT